MKRSFFLMLTVMWGITGFGQIRDYATGIDSVVSKINIAKENYRYWYGSGDNTWIDFRMDSVKRKLIRVSYKVEKKDTILVDYYFSNNYLIKVHTSKLIKGKYLPIANYYYQENSLIKKKGPNYNLRGKGFFRKASPKYIKKQLTYLYSQFEYLNLYNKNMPVDDPILLLTERAKVQKRYQNLQ